MGEWDLIGALRVTSAGRNAVEVKANDNNDMAEETIVFMIIGCRLRGRSVQALGKSMQWGGRAGAAAIFVPH